MYFSKEFVSKMFRVGALFTITLLLMDLLTFFFYQDTEIGKIFLATREQTPLTWVSAVVLLLIALSCATAYMKSKRTLWYVLSLIFFFFSIDDATYFHERFSAALQEMIPFMQAFPSYSWILIYLPFLLFGLGALIYILWKEAAKKDKKLLLISIFLLGLSLLLDMIDGFVGKDATLVFCYVKNCDLVVTHLFRLTEEVMEVFGLGIISYLSIKKNSLLKR
ncbi:hypothetical protein ACFLZK_00330 [Patescibacteria group bacterium]